VGLKEIPIGFERETEFTLSMYTIGAAFGVDIRDLGYALGVTGQTKADAEIQDAKTTGRGRADAMRTIERFMNTRVLPEGLVFTFDNKDDLEDERRAKIHATRATTRAARIASGEISIAEAREIAARDGDLPSEFMQSRTVVTQDDSAQSAPSDPTDFETNAPAPPLSPIIKTPRRRLAKALAKKKRTLKGYRDEARDRLEALIYDNLRRLTDPTDPRQDPYARAQKIQDIFTLYAGKAFLFGMADAGTRGLALSDLDPDERRTLNALIDENASYALGVALDAFDMTTAQKRERASLWASKALDSVYNAGKLAARDNPPLKWVLGPTEHCQDCLRYSGKIYRAKMWKKYGAVPRASALECGGFRCQCKLIPTKDPITRGRPARPRGRKVFGLAHHLASKSSKYSHIDFKPSQAMADNARRALDVRAEKPPSQRGMTGVGLARARQLINRQTLSPQTVRRMLAYFTRHEVDKQGATWQDKGKGWQAWQGWGGDAGFAWARARVRQMNAADKR
jgi:hypothetical protein